jgi:D-alanyl-D-alanine carboxypeptidase
MPSCKIKPFIALPAAALLLVQPAHAGPALLYDASNGQVLYADDADQPWYPASLTKMMTAYVVFGAWKAGRAVRESKIIISAKANAQPKMRLGLGTGKEIGYDDAIAAIIVKSANDIAVALAEAVAGSEEAFVAEMNDTAQRLGMYGTHFINPNGLPGEGQYTTAKDLALLAQAIQRDFPEHMHFFSMPTAKIGKRMITTHNSVLIHVEGGDGMKTGFTCSAGYNIVASATRNGRRLVAIVLGETSSGKRTIRTASLLEYGFRMRDWKSLFPAPAVESLPEGAYDRELVRVANLNKRYTDCLDPVPPTTPVVAATGDPAQAAAAAATTGAIQKADAPAAPVKKAGKGKTKQAAAAKSKRRNAKKKQPAGDGSPQQIMLARP